MWNIITNIDWTEVILGIFAVGLTLWSKHQSELLKTKEKENTLLKDNIYSTKISKLKQIFDLRYFSAIEHIQHKVFDETCADRLTIMFMMNGKVNFNYMTVLYDHSSKRPDVGVESPYLKVRMSDRYMNTISNLRINDSHWESWPFSEWGELGDYIEMEGIRHLGWYKVRRVALDEYNDLLMYLSWSTEQEHEPSWEDRRKIQLLTTGYIIPLLDKIIDSPEEVDPDHLLEKINTSGDK